MFRCCTCEAEVRRPLPRTHRDALPLGVGSEPRRLIPGSPGPERAGRGGPSMPACAPAVLVGFSESAEQFGGNRHADNAGPPVPDLSIYSLYQLCSFFRSFVMESFRLTKVEQS